MRRLMLLDDEPSVLTALQRTLRQCSFADSIRIEVFTEPRDAMRRAIEVDFDVVISDYRMPQMNGVTFLQRLRQIQPHAVLLMLTGSTEFATVVDAVNDAGVFHYISKPWCRDSLEEVIVAALARRDQEDRLQMRLGELTPQALAERHLETDEPGITAVNWGADGSVHLN